MDPGSVDRNSAATVVIVGGGIVGTSVAWHLKTSGFAGRVVVFESDPTYARSSTALSAAAIRTQFGCPVNVRMSLHGARFFREFKAVFGADADIGFAEKGYLILGREEDREARSAAIAMQRAEGASVAILDRGELGERFPWLATDGIGFGTFGERNEGWFDAWSLLQAMRRAAREAGVTYVAERVERLVPSGERIAAVVTRNGTRVDCDWCVNAAGATAAKLMSELNETLPVEPRKRTAFYFRAPVDAPNFPMLFDVSGAWIRPEGEGFISGIAPPDDADPNASEDFEPAHDMLEDVVWPTLAERIPALEQLRLERSWAGHYEVNLLDHNGIIGPHDRLANLIFATGFSGHGVMHAPATGRGVAELILHGRYTSIDLSPLGYSRIRSNQPLVETTVY